MVTRTSVMDMVLGNGSAATLAKAHVLLVGCGGVGCEVLKNLAIAGIGNVDVIDLDTIDVSNLNRQFLFQRQHVGMLKSLVAAQRVREFNPNVVINPYNGNIMDPIFSTTWFQRFDLVINALDNAAARKHVNTMCITAGVPVVESGTKGFHGQTRVHIPGLTQCYQCDAKISTEKTYPVCTIRSTPSAPIHCIVWARNFLLNQLFGAPQDIEDDIPAAGEDVSEADRKRLKSESQSFNLLVTGNDRYQSEAWIPKVFRKVFDTDIETLLKMDDLWANGKRKPTPLNYESGFDSIANGKRTVANDFLPKFGTELDFEQKVWEDVETNFAVLVESMRNLNSRIYEGRVKSNDAQFGISFDKDDQDTMLFVTAAANLRSLNYGITLQSFFDAKQMAGNIIPAVSTTNAVIAGAVLSNAILILTKRVPLSKRLGEPKITVPLADVYVDASFKFDLAWIGPQEHCHVCQHANFVLYKFPTTKDLETNTLGKFLDSLKLPSILPREDAQLLGKLNDKTIKRHASIGGLALCECGDITVMKGEDLIYDADLDDYIDTNLKELAVKPGTRFTVIFDPSVEYPQFDNLEELTDEQRNQIRQHAIDHLGISSNDMKHLSDKELLVFAPRATTFNIEIDSSDATFPESNDPIVVKRPAKRKLSASSSSSKKGVSISIPQGLYSKTILGHTASQMTMVSTKTTRTETNVQDGFILNKTHSFGVFIPKRQYVEPPMITEVKPTPSTNMDDEIITVS